MCSLPAGPDAQDEFFFPEGLDFESESGASTSSTLVDTECDFNVCSDTAPTIEHEPAPGMALNASPHMMHAVASSATGLAGDISSTEPFVQCIPPVPVSQAGDHSGACRTQPPPILLVVLLGPVQGARSRCWGPLLVGAASSSFFLAACGLVGQMCLLFSPNGYGDLGLLRMLLLVCPSSSRAQGYFSGFGASCRGGLPSPVVPGVWAEPRFTPSSPSLSGPSRRWCTNSLGTWLLLPPCSSCVDQALWVVGALCRPTFPDRPPEISRDLQAVQRLLCPGLLRGPGDSSGGGAALTQGLACCFACRAALVPWRTSPAPGVSVGFSFV